MMLPSELIRQCYATDPEKRFCNDELGHVGVHENSFGTWFGGVWFTQRCPVCALDLRIAMQWDWCARRDPNCYQLRTS